MSNKNNWGGARKGAGRKPFTQIQRCHDLMAKASSDQDWIEVMAGLFDIAKASEADRARIRASEILMRYQFAMTKNEPPPEEPAPEPIRIIEVHSPPGFDKEIRTTDIHFPEGCGIPDKFRWGYQGQMLRIVIPPEAYSEQDDSSGPAGIVVHDSADSQGPEEPYIPGKPRPPIIGDDFVAFDELPADLLASLPDEPDDPAAPTPPAPPASLPAPEPKPARTRRARGKSTRTKKKTATLPAVPASAAPLPSDPPLSEEELARRTRLALRRPLYFKWLMEQEELQRCARLEKT